MEDKKQFCEGCEELVEKLEDYTGRDLCESCSEKYDNKTGWCSLSCCLGNGCDQTC